MPRRLFELRSDRGVLVLLAAIFGGVALILLLIAGGLALHTRSFLGDAASAEGTVVELVGRQSCSTDDDHRRTCSTVYAPRVRFTTADGREIEYLSTNATSPPAYHEGQQVDVRYRPADPTDARIHSFVDLWLAPVIVGGIGVIFGVVAAALAFIPAALRRRAQAAATARSEPEGQHGWQDPGTLR